jgi:NADPH-dependent glutamate synthase beta subunit-like oxidoreductase/Pyruvate/2-oxoacid:ferredoxin oxidoreductase delta subunit
VGKAETLMKGERKYPKPVSFASEKEMPYCDLAVATTEWNQTGSWRYLRPRYVQRIAACQFSCPTGNNIEDWIRLLEKDKIQEAWEVCTLENPFPAIMGRVCFHPCMDGCNRQELGGAVNIQMLERALGESMGDSLPPAKPLFPPTGKKIAVIGSGPAGLACAYHLCRLGHGAVVFEKEPQAGGMLRYGIPSYRLPKELLDREIKRLAKMGIDFRLATPIKDAAQMQMLRQDFDAVFLAPGAHRSKSLGIKGEGAKGVISGLELLKMVSLGQRPSLGRLVLVVGGGNTAVDAARVALRLGAEVRILYRRTEAEMPAFEEEIHEAIAEGVALETLVAPKRVAVTKGRVGALVCQRMRLGEPDESGRRRPIPVEDSDVSFEADSIILAIGEEIDTTVIPSALHAGGGVIRTGAGGRTEWRDVFAGGDFAAQPRTVADALGAGKRSAIAIDCFLRGERFEDISDAISMAGADPGTETAGSQNVLMSRYLQLRTGRAPRMATTSETTAINRVTRFEDLNAAYFTLSEPCPTPALTVEERLGLNPFAEIHHTASPDVLDSELARCFHCGRCTECDNCYIYCPDVAVAKKEGGFEIDLYYCKGCGVCMQECPRAAMEMIDEPTELEKKP